MAAISKADYLKRYMSKDEQRKEEKKKKKRKVKSTRDPALKIIDDDIDFKRLQHGQNTEDDGFNDEAPTVAEIIDERPQHIQQLEIYRKNSRWKVLGEADEDALNFGVIGSPGDISLPVSKITGRKRHDSSESDSSPLRLKSRRVDQGLKIQRHDSGSSSDGALDKKKKNDQRKHRVHHDSDSDISPPRQTHITRNEKLHVLKSNDTASKEKIKSIQTSRRADGRHDTGYDHSPPRKRGGSPDSDPSPPRKRKGNSDSDPSPPRKGKGNPDSDPSPPRKQKGNSASTLSPPRKHKGGPGSDQSPQRISAAGGHKSSKASRVSRFDSELSREETKKAAKTLSGAKAGLSSAGEMKEEARQLRDKEDLSFQNIDEVTLGRHAKTIVRDKETGKRRDMKAEEAKNDDDEKKKEEQLKKYQQWGKGLKQLAMHEARLEEQVHEASKPLARYSDDKDLDDMLRKEERAEDPMLAFIKTKKKKEEEKSGKVKKKEMPKYRGPAPPPNRFNLMPGYRWDGVDRSNGFEKKIFAQQANKKAVQEMAYKWSTEDM